jgi:glycosyltransferase involved in cell wall biosynthesis
MRIGVNALTHDPGCGKASDVYLHNVLGVMRAVQPATQFTIFTSPRNHAAFEGWDRVLVEDQPTGILDRFSGGSKLNDRTVRQAEVDALFSPAEAAPSRCSVPLVLYAIDLVFVDSESSAGKSRVSSEVRSMANACDQAVAIVVPSKFMQSKFLEFLGVAMDKCIVAPFGADPVFEQPADTIVEKPYFLAVTETHALSNMERLMAAFEKIGEEFPHKLVLAGTPGDLERDNWGPRVLRVEQAPANVMAGLYQHCGVMVCPSLYEASGGAILEAMRSGARVAAGRIGGIPEVGGRAPIYYNPESTASMIGAIRRGLTEDVDGNRAQLLRTGQQSAAEFTWEKCAWKTLSAFKR